MATKEKIILNAFDSNLCFIAVSLGCMEKTICWWNSENY